MLLTGIDPIVIITYIGMDFSGGSCLESKDKIALSKETVSSLFNPIDMSDGSCIMDVL